MSDQAAARQARERGSVTLESAILAPALIGFLALVVFGGLYLLAQQAVDQAAWDAARETTIARTAGEARANATSRAAAALNGQLHCLPAPYVVVDTSQFARPVGQPAEARVSVSCTIAIPLTVPGLPDTITLQADATSPLDTYRGRT
jgi:Flp pilus assembly protein TadG